MRITIYSNAPWAPTGYGTQTAQLTDRLVADGHEVAIASNYGAVCRREPWIGQHGQLERPVVVYPGGPDAYGQWGISAIHEHHKGDVILTLYDTWVLDPAAFGGHPVLSWVPVDSVPLTEGSRTFGLHPGHRSVAMSLFGQRILAEGGIEAPYAPHGITRDYAPTPSDIRSRMGVPADAFLVVVNAANKGLPPRKCWVQMLTAFHRFALAHDDAYLYMHTDMTFPGGMHIPNWVRLMGIPEARLRNVDQFAYRLGDVVTPEDMASIYTAADVLLSPSMGEGFGLAVPEAMACGTPAIVTDFSAQPELVGDTGWKVPADDPEPSWDRGTLMVHPHPTHILRALEAAYAERGTEAATQRSQAAIAKAAEYDADTVYAERWRPLLARLEADLAPKPSRKGMSRGAQKRKAKAA